MADHDFQLTSPLSPVSNAFAIEVLQSIRLSEESDERRHPIKVGWNSRMPIAIKRQLVKAAKKHRCSMTTIECVALGRLLPALLTDEELRAAAAGAEPADDGPDFG